MEIKFNLTKLLSTVNSVTSILTDEEVVLYLNDDNSLNLKMGEASYRISHKMLQKVVDEYDTEKKYQHAGEDFVINLLCRDLVNKLMTSQGQISYSRMKMLECRMDYKKRHK